MPPIDSKTTTIKRQTGAAANVQNNALVCYEECKTGTDNDAEECCTFNISVTGENKWGYMVSESSLDAREAEKKEKGKGPVPRPR